MLECRDLQVLMDKLIIHVPNDPQILPLDTHTHLKKILRHIQRVYRFSSVIEQIITILEVLNSTFIVSQIMWVRSLGLA